MHRRAIGLSAVVLLVVGVGEAVWLFESSGLTLLTRLFGQVFGAR
jgi:hypothetical protein